MNVVRKNSERGQYFTENFGIYFLTFCLAQFNCGAYVLTPLPFLVMVPQIVVRPKKYRKAVVLVIKNRKRLSYESTNILFKRVQIKMVKSAEWLPTLKLDARHLERGMVSF